MNLVNPVYFIGVREGSAVTHQDHQVTQPQQQRLLGCDDKAEFEFVLAWWEAECVTWRRLFVKYAVGNYLRFLGNPGECDSTDQDLEVWEASLNPRYVFHE